MFRSDDEDSVKSHVKKKKENKPKKKKIKNDKSQGKETDQEICKAQINNVLQNKKKILNIAAVIKIMIKIKKKKKKLHGNRNSLKMKEVNIQGAW